ncbi:TetR/AcrR family transcriptional regulator [Kribbella endophytica]
MPEVKRSYDASGRREQAEARRRAVVVAAQELFARDGFRATTIAAVARNAGVSAESVYKGFGTKAALAKAVFDRVIAGDDEPVPVVQRAEAQAIAAEPDVRKKLALYAGGAAERQVRSAGVQILIRDGRHVDETLEEVWQNLLAERLTGMTMLATHLHGTGQLRAGLDVDEVRDLLWTYISVEVYELLVLDRDWPLDRYTAWLARTLVSALL